MAAKGVLRTMQRNPGFGGADIGFYCPGCKEVHGICITPGPDGKGPVWGFNGNYERPTFTPSIRVQGVILCHTFITDGIIQFLPDCTHELKGQFVRLQPFGDDIW